MNRLTKLTAGAASALAIAATGLGAAAAAGPGATPEFGASGHRPIANRITIRTTGMNYHVHGRLHPGTGAITWVNSDDEAHMMALARLTRGTTVRHVIHVLRKHGEPAIYRYLADGPDHSYGQSAILGGHRRDTVTMTGLRSGHYLIICFLADQDGTPHWQMGMYSSFRVQGARRHARPTSNGTIVLTDHGIRWPSHYRGSGTYRVVNRGSHPHGLSVARLEHGTSLGQYFAYVGGQMAANRDIDGGGGVMSGGIDILGPLQHSWMTLSLRPGHYGYLSPEDATGPQLPAQSGTFQVR